MDDYKEREYVILRTYKSVWKVPKKIYSIDNIKLLVPINTEEMVYFLASAALTFIMLKLLPFLNVLPAVIKYALIPYGLMKFFTKQKLDGKLPHKFFIDYAIFFFSPKKSLRFKDIADYKEVRFTTPVVMRDIEIINKTTAALTAGKKTFGRRDKKTNV